MWARSPTLGSSAASVGLRLICGFDPSEGHCRRRPCMQEPAQRLPLLPGAVSAATADPMTPTFTREKIAARTDTAFGVS